MNALTSAEALRDVAGGSISLTEKVFDSFVLNGRIRNFSIAGVHVQVDRTLEPMTAVTLRLRGVGALHGRVAWRRSDRIAVAFDDGPDPVVELVRDPA
jgi:hypothetical protein